MSKLTTDKDECYVIDLCDALLRSEAKRQHRFDFLLGCPGKNGHCVRLPVDAYYENFSLVIEYREIQHTQSNKFIDKPERLTCCGCHRGEQRALYDE